jgi:hypothetical protein
VPILPSVLAAMLAPFLRTDASEEWGESLPEDADGCANEALCRLEREQPALAQGPVDLTTAAAKAKYTSGSLKGKLKRIAYPPVPLAKRRVVIALHQFGVEIPARWPSWHKVTCHWGIRTDAVPLHVHPVTTRLMATNRFDRAPWHAVAIEFAGNFEGVDGSGRWSHGERNGRGRVSQAQIVAGRWTVAKIIEQVAEAGGKVEGIVPHLIAGRDSRGRPNRQICPGSRIWSEVGEWSAAEFGLAIPGPGFALGGLPLTPTWHGPYHEVAARRLLTA